jgi:hypothetical protein
LFVTAGCLLGIGLVIRAHVAPSAKNDVAPSAKDNVAPSAKGSVRCPYCGRAYYDHRVELVTDMGGIGLRGVITRCPHCAREGDLFLYRLLYTHGHDDGKAAFWELDRRDIFE